MSGTGANSNSSVTFSSPTSPTKGLQPYNLEKPIKNLYPAPPISVRGKSRTYKNNFRYHTENDNIHRVNRLIRKGAIMADSNSLDGMIETLSKSVSGIVSASPPNMEELLNKSFSEFGEELTKAIEIELTEASVTGAQEVLDNSMVTELLYKDIGTVGRVADMLRHITNVVDDLKKDSDDNHEQLSPEVAHLLDNMANMGGLALHAAVNEHVGVPEDSEIEDPDSLEEGYHLIMVPSAFGSEEENSEDQGVILKTYLPEGLAKFAIDPAVIAQAAIELGAGLMIDGGVPENIMAKMFGSDNDLSKAFPPKKEGGDSEGGGSDKPAPKKGPPQSDSGEGGPPREGQSDDGGDGEGSVPPEMGSDDGSDQTNVDMGGAEQDDPLTVLGRILAAGMIQLDHIQQMVEGADQSAPPGPDQGAAGPPSGAPPVAPQVAKVAPDGALNKAAPTEDLKFTELQKAFTEMKAEFEKFKSMPQASKGVLQTVTLEKGADVTFGSNEVDITNLAKEIDALPPGEEKTRRLMKLTFAAGPGKIAGPSGELPGALGGNTFKA